jgi:hypothetical protein
MISTNQTKTQYIQCNATVVSTKFAKTLFTIEKECVEKFEKLGITVKSKEYNDKISYSIPAKIQPEGINALYGCVNLGDLVVGAKYSVVFRVYKWTYQNETGVSLNAFVGELLEQPHPRVPIVDESIREMLNASK